MLEEGSADYLIGFEWLETLRRFSYVSPQGTIVVNDCRLDPIKVSSGEMEYPEKEFILDQLKKAARKVHVIPGLQAALDLGNARTLNIVVMGALSGLLETSCRPVGGVFKKEGPQKID